MVRNLKLMKLVLKITAASFILNLYGCDREDNNSKSRTIELEIEQDNYDLKNNEGVIIS